MSSTESSALFWLYTARWRRFIVAARSVPTRSASLDALTTENAKIGAENDLLKAQNLKLTGELDHTKQKLAAATKTSVPAIGLVKRAPKAES